MGDSLIHIEVTTAVFVLCHHGTFFSRDLVVDNLMVDVWLRQQAVSTREETHTKTSLTGLWYYILDLLVTDKLKKKFQNTHTFLKKKLFQCIVKEKI